MFEKGQYLKKKDGQRISKSNKYPVVRVNDCRVDPAREGGVIINACMRIMPEWFDVITEEEYNAVRDDPKYSNPQQTQASERTKELPFKVGDYFRKSNWEFIRDQPCMKIKSVSNKNCHAGSVYINNHAYQLDGIVKLTEEDFNEILDKWNNMQLSEVLDGRLETVHYREDTGEEKKGRKEIDALRYTFTYNNKFPGKDMNAYKCPYCSEIHCGKVPKPQPDISKGVFTQEEQDVITLSRALEIRINNYFPKSKHLYRWEHMYKNDGRICLGTYDVVATQRHFNGGWVQLYEIIPYFIKRYTMDNIPRNSWRKENRGMRTAYMPGIDVIKYVLQQIINKSELNRLQKFKLFARLLYKKKFFGEI